MRFVIVTGMSGAGKSTALNRLEDMGYFCVDNLPISLISKFAENKENTERIFIRADKGISEEFQLRYRRSRGWK